MKTKCGNTVGINGKEYQIARQNSVNRDGKPWFYWNEAQEYAKDAPAGWRLPTPTEAMALSAITCLEHGCTTLDADVIMDEFQIELVGTGLSLGHGSEFFAQNVGEEVAFWTSEKRNDDPTTIDMPSGIALRVCHGSVQIQPILMHDRGACVRLIREIPNVEHSGFRMPYSVD